MNEPPFTASQTTIVYQPEPGTDLQDLQPSALASQMNSIPYAPSPPEAPTFPSVPSEEEIYGVDRYAGYHPDFPEYAPSTPGPPPSVHFNPAPFTMGGMQTDSLVQRDFKDELTRAAGAVTPGVSDTPYIRYAIEALTRQQGDDSMIPSRINIPQASGERYLPRAQIIPQFSVEVSPRSPSHQSLGAADSVDESASGGWQPVPGGWQVPFPIPISPGVEPREERQAPVDEPQTPIDERPAASQLASQPVKHPDQRRIDEITDQFYRVKTLVEQGIPAPANNHSPPRMVEVWRAQPDSFHKHDLEAIGYRSHAPPLLTHKPWILRPLSLLLLATLCVLVITALIFSAVYSIGRDGFTAYAGTIYGGQYFLFRVLPQLIGAVLLIYAQCIVATVFRVFPFSAMASDDRRERRNAVFLPLFPTSFLWPRLFGPWQVWVPTVVIWLTNFTIPLLSSLYTVVLVDGVWRWSTVQGVAWTLVAVYVSLLLSTVVLFVYWRHRRTGMIQTWDVRSIADIIFLLSPSNSLPQYRGLETVASRGEMKKVLDGTAERLGYWTTPEVPENSIFWGIGVPTTEEDIEVEKLDKKNWATQRDASRPVMLPDVEDQKQPWAVRFRCLPWCFRDSPIILFVVAEALLLIVLIVVSFLPSTDLRDGFLPRLSAAPLAGAFSPADFLYSFLPSLIGLALFLGFQSLDLTLRILAPWGELAREEGSRAETSLLLDYAACLPWQSTFKAIKLKHWRVAFVTFLSPLFVLIPVLSGGLFMALTPPSGAVRIFPNVPIFSLILALLFLHLAAMASLIPCRKQFRLPHAVTCLAEIMSFCCNEQLRTDEAFDQGKISRRTELKGALDCGKDWHRQGRWTFGAGKNNEERLGIKRYSKFTVNSTKLRQYDKYVRGKPISGPLLNGSGPLFGHY
ncbi:hypothetical protein EKO27_g11635 [Xylaria grammica]|uniref:Phosphoribosylaminoimidazole-succinocarboxamide synthase n=1 Tax=Xylaria grammica TaxID=363999 RepID=A0A439CMS9_9PEZI|nr:hypothetical protein EKO27_g11635 [Xylaria grammica]